MRFQTLQNIIENVRSDIFRLEEAIYLLEFIGENAENINKKYGVLFGRIQLILEENIINLLSKIFEKPKNYPLNSIPALKGHLNDIKDELVKFEESAGEDFLNPATKNLLVKIGINAHQIKKPLNDVILKKIDHHLGTTKKIRSNIKNWRDKVFNHHERLNDNQINFEDVFLPEKKKLLNDAKILISIIENIYLNVSTVDYHGVNYLPTEDSKAVVITLNNLLVDSDLLERREARKKIKSLFN